MDTQNEDRTDYHARIFANRLRKKYRELRRWARKSRVTCYRLYDRDIPEVPLCVDLYELLPGGIDSPMEAAKFLAAQNARISAGDTADESDIKSRTYAVIYLYEKSYKSSYDEAWLSVMAASAAEVLEVPENHVVRKFRGRKNHKSDDGDSLAQYQKSGASAAQDITIKGMVQEQGQIFHVDLTSYLDTGLFLDHRPLREAVRTRAAKKRVLNLFCYTGSFSVYAAQGGAKSVESVDLSHTYLAWAQENMRANGFTDKKKYSFIRADCVRFLQEKALDAKKGTLKKDDFYDLIVLDPPTFSNSKSASNVLDIRRDWPQLVKDCLNILAPGGTLYFSSNAEHIKIDEQRIPARTISESAFTCTEITQDTIPRDFSARRPHKVWEFRLTRAQSF